MLKKILITFLFIILSTNLTFADSKTSKILSRIENNLFGIEYKNQNESTRLSRIEEQVYGEAKSGNIKTRLENLSKDIATNQMGQEITPKRDTFEEENETFTQEKVAKTTQEEYYEPDNPKIEYPTVNELEEQIFGKTYKNLDINTRLSKLEKETFKKTYEDALSDRVDRLKNKLAYTKPQTQEENYFSNNNSADGNYFSPNNTYQPQDNYFSPENYNNTPYENYYSQQMLAQNPNDTYTEKQRYQAIDENISDRNFRSKLNKLEKNVYRQSFSDDNIDNRLSRLESTIFKTNFSSDKNTTRLSRIASAVEAQKSAKKYDSNGFQQKMATAMQIGMFVLMVVAMIL